MAEARPDVVLTRAPSPKSRQSPLVRDGGCPANFRAIAGTVSLQRRMAKQKGFEPSDAQHAAFLSDRNSIVPTLVMRPNAYNARPGWSIASLLPRHHPTIPAERCGIHPVIEMDEPKSWEGRVSTICAAPQTEASGGNVADPARFLLPIADLV